MVGNIDIYFSENPNTPHFREDENYKIRKEKAIEQSALQPVSLYKIINYVNEFLDEIEIQNGKKSISAHIDELILDGSRQIILNKGIIAKGLKWKVPVWDDKIGKYAVWEPKYSVIQEKFNLRHTKNIIWLKFTDSGHLGAVAKGMDINFNRTTTSGKLIEEAGKNWDTSFALIFPLNEVLLYGREAGDIERAVGNYLISKNVPIIDFYSHNY